MITTDSLAELRSVCSELPRPLGLVPTMGFLHEGHLSLVRAARRASASVAVSIFVNPTQFGPGEDFDSYPRDRDRDIRLLEEEGVDVVWTPSEDSLYPPGFQTWVQVEDVTQRLEGAHRPEHFRGVTTVVSKLFNTFQPDLAVFGQKDAQQVVVIRRMVRDLNFPVEIKVGPIVREPDGLAMSSRNTYLNPAQREAATVLHQALSAAVEAYEHGEREAAALRRRMTEVLAEEPLADPEYVSVADPVNLEELEGQVASALLSLAVHVGKTRLIDNMLVGDARLGG
ncbi:MAG: pantoate--beta-alanine ligase [Anaerolineales bacterium]|nr:pantoate--beta-alanine ligase [Anaerolineales bacterium]